MGTHTVLSGILALTELNATHLDACSYRAVCFVLLTNVKALL